jgi:hydrophobic/amphiphilic exporter-1 (mainly G- bacteria), HAE1 family
MIIGMIPMALGIGEGAEVRAPMAITVIGGVLLTTFLTLIVIPVVYATLDRREQAGDRARAPAADGAESLAPGRS